MERFREAAEAFEHAILRAKDLLKLFDALTLIDVGPIKDDALRAAYIQAVSSFDFYVHEIVAIEAVYRFRNGIATKNIVLPMEITAIQDINERIVAVDNSIRERFSYKAFVSPDKIGEVLSCFCASPWDKILVEHGRIHGIGIDRDSLKSQLKSIWGRRNKIAHEADINPALSGVTLWPIDKIDTEITVDFILKLGRCLPGVVSLPL